MPIVPDTKNWTWVLERRCPECGFDAGTLDPDDVAGLIRDNLPAWRPLLAGSAHVAERPADDRWSALEYTCHVRDVYRLYDVRLHLMLDQDDPTFPDWDQDETAITDGYARQDPAVVLDELERAGADLARSFDAVHGDAWARTGTRSDGTHFTVDTFARYLIHDPVHHLWDVAQGLAQLDADS